MRAGPNKKKPHLRIQMRVQLLEENGTNSEGGACFYAQLYKIALPSIVVQDSQIDQRSRNK